jgi:hypothetical protein
MASASCLRKPHARGTGKVLSLGECRGATDLDARPFTRIKSHLIERLVEPRPCSIQTHPGQSLGLSFARQHPAGLGSCRSIASNTEAVTRCDGRPTASIVAHVTCVNLGDIEIGEPERPRSGRLDGLVLAAIESRSGNLDWMDWSPQPTRSVSLDWIDLPSRPIVNV